MTQERQQTYDEIYMKIAKTISELSYANRNKVGCVIVSADGQLISQGFNGTPSGYDNCCEDKVYNYIPGKDCKHPDSCAKGKDGTCKGCLLSEQSKEYTLVTKREVLHAESNAISKCAKWHSSTEGATLYVTLSPCFDCAKMIIQSGIKRVCYEELYRDSTGLDFLKKNNIEVKLVKV